MDKKRFIGIMFGLLMTIPWVVLIWVTLSQGGSGEIILRVTCTGSWSGYYTGIRYHYVKGTGNKIFTIKYSHSIPIYENPTVIVAMFKKEESGSYELKLTLETPDGKILSSGSTTHEFGVVTVTWMVES